VGSSSSLDTTPVPESITVKQSKPGTTKKWKHRVKLYPFNIYDDTVNQVVRYPAHSGGIPDLAWKDIKYFKTCCKNENAFRCFPTDEVVLKRDPERTLKKLPDVYLEITRRGDRNPPIGSVGSRCQLMWSVEHADVED
jgi:hypothetical protein